MRNIRIKLKFNQTNQNYGIIRNTFSEYLYTLLVFCIKLFRQNVSYL